MGICSKLTETKGSKKGIVAAICFIVYFGLSLFWVKYDVSRLVGGCKVFDLSTTSMLVLHLMVKIEFFLERYKDLAHPLTETLGACRRSLWA